MKECQEGGKVRRGEGREKKRKNRHEERSGIEKRTEKRKEGGRITNQCQQRRMLGRKRSATQKEDIRGGEG